MRPGRDRGEPCAVAEDSQQAAPCTRRRSSEDARAACASHPHAWMLQAWRTSHELAGEQRQGQLPVVEPIVRRRRVVPAAAETPPSNGDFDPDEFRQQPPAAAADVPTRHVSLRMSRLGSTRRGSSAHAGPAQVWSYLLEAPPGKFQGNAMLPPFIPGAGRHIQAKRIAPCRCSCEQSCLSPRPALAPGRGRLSKGPWKNKDMEWQRIRNRAVSVTRCKSQLPDLAFLVRDLRLRRAACARRRRSASITLPSASDGSPSGIGSSPRYPRQSLAFTAFPDAFRSASTASGSAVPFGTISSMLTALPRRFLWSLTQFSRALTAPASSRRTSARVMPYSRNVHSVRRLHEIADLDPFLWPLPIAAAPGVETEAGVQPVAPHPRTGPAGASPRRSPLRR